MYSFSLVILLASVFSKSLKEHCDANGLITIKYLSVEPNFTTTAGARDCSNGKCFPYSIYSSCAQEAYFKYTPTADNPFNTRFLDEMLEEDGSRRSYDGIDFQASPETIGDIHYYIRNSFQAKHILNIPFSYYLTKKKMFDFLAYLYTWDHQIVVRINQTDAEKIRMHHSFYHTILLVADSHEIAKNISKVLALQKIYVKEKKDVLDSPLMKSFDIISVYED